MTDYCMVMVTADSSAQAQHLARHILEKRLAACVQVFPMTSHYRWEGALQESAEIMLFIKTKRAVFERLRDEILAQHSYQVPEIIMLPIMAGLTAYLNWIDESLADQQP